MPEIFLLTQAVLLGLIVGSFLNVCILRLPSGKSLGGRSIAPCCGKQISWHHNIPVLSFVFLRGRCANCHKKISRQYPFVEGITAILSVLTLVHENYSLIPYLLWFILFVAPLIAIVFIDFAHQIIPDVISIPGIPAGFLAVLLLRWPEWKESLLFSSAGMLAGGLSLLLLAWAYEKIRKREGMGGGDVKFAAMLGAFLGWQGIIFVFMISSILALLYGIVYMTFNRRKLGPLVIPYGPFLAIAALIFYAAGEAILRFYWNLSI